jgi:hypothetical protein
VNGRRLLDGVTIERPPVTISRRSLEGLTTLHEVEQLYARQLRAANIRRVEGEVEYSGVNASYESSTRTLHVPGDIQIMTPTGPRALNLDDRLEAHLARLHARVQVEEVAHMAGGSIRPGSFVPLGNTERLVAFHAWMQGPSGQAHLARMSETERSLALRTVHELDIHDIHVTNAQYSHSEIARYPVRRLYHHFLQERSTGH